MRFIIFRGTDKQFYFRIVAGNGEAILISEGHKRRRTVIETINSLIAHIQDGKFEIEGKK